MELETTWNANYRVTQFLVFCAIPRTKVSRKVDSDYVFSFRDIMELLKYICSDVDSSTYRRISRRIELIFIQASSVVEKKKKIPGIFLKSPLSLRSTKLPFSFKHTLHKYYINQNFSVSFVDLRELYILDLDILLRLHLK